MEIYSAADCQQRNITRYLICGEWQSQHTERCKQKHVCVSDNDNDNNNNNLTIEIERMWNVKTKVIPVIIGATWTISKSFRKYVSNVPGNHEVKELQKTAILGTTHILRKVLTERYNGVNAGTSDMSTMNSNTRIAATRCSLRMWFVSGI